MQLILLVCSLLSAYSFAKKINVGRVLYSLDGTRGSCKKRQRELRARRTPRSLGSQIAIAKVGCERNRSIDAFAKIRENIGGDEFSDGTFEALKKGGDRGGDRPSSRPDRGGDRGVCEFSFGSVLSHPCYVYDVRG